MKYQQKYRVAVKKIQSKTKHNNNNNNIYNNNENNKGYYCDQWQAI